jgi:hypothetical protein
VDGRGCAGLAFGAGNGDEPGRRRSQKKGNIGLYSRCQLQVRGVGADPGVFYHHIGVFKIIPVVTTQNITSFDPRGFKLPYGWGQSFLIP